MVAYAPVNITASTTLSQKRHGDSTVTVNAAAGLTLTLPAASGTGSRFRIFVGTTVTSNNVVIQVANSSDVMSGSARVAQDGGDTAVAFETASTSDTITLNGTTTGGIKGDFIELEDVATNLWRVSAVLSATGTEATPFSAAV
jgi:hypothetical protein